MSLMNDEKPPQLSPDVVQKLICMVSSSSPRGVDEVLLNAPFAPGVPESPALSARIIDMVQFFFREIKWRVIIFMQHDQRLSHQLRHLVFALERFALDVKQHQTCVDNLDMEDEIDEEDEDFDEREQEQNESTDDDDDDLILDNLKKEEDDEASMDDEDETPYALEFDDTTLSCPNFDELFPPVSNSLVSSNECVPMRVLAQTWNETLTEFGDVQVSKESKDLFYDKLSKSLNAYILSCFESRRLDSEFPDTDR